jgi:hypothetical protein
MGSDDILTYLTAWLPDQEAEGEDCVGKLGALDADIRRVQARLAHVASDSIPSLLPSGLRHAMLHGGVEEEGGGGGEGGSRKRPRLEQGAAMAAEATPAGGGAGAGLHANGAGRGVISSLTVRQSHPCILIVDRAGALL